MPVISKEPLDIPGTHDFSINDLTYTPPDKTEKAVFEKEGKFLLWVGDMNGDKMVEESDFTVWLQKRRLDQSNPVADLNGDGMVDESDFTLWLESRRGIGKQTGNQSYVP